MIMRPLSARDVLYIWELGQHQHPLDRALTLLEVALPDHTRADLANLSIGQRDALLLALREMTLGDTLESFAECPQCHEPLEFTLSTRDLRVMAPDRVLPSDYTLTTEEIALRFRLPTSRDLAAIATCNDLATAQQQLTERCIHQAQWQGADIAPHALPVAVLHQLAEQMAQHDPQAETLLDLTCPACHHAWQVLFDIVVFFWSELTTQAKRLMREVHCLARAYGWREADILALSEVRRQYYLDLVSE